MRTVLLAALTMASTAHAQAQQFTSPDDLLSTLYEAYRSGRSVDYFEPYFSDRLAREMSGARVTSEVLQRLGLDPISGSHKPGLITVFNLATVESGSITAETVASFWNAGVPVSITFDLVFEDEAGWQIDHMSGVAGDKSWCSGDLIAAARASASSPTN